MLDCIDKIGKIYVTENDHESHNLIGFWYTSDVNCKKCIYVLLADTNNLEINNKYSNINLEQLKRHKDIKKIKISTSKLDVCSDTLRKNIVRSIMNDDCKSIFRDYFG